MEIDAFVLIGGRSTRLGRDKAFVRAGGSTLARRALDTVAAGGIARKIKFVAGSEAQFGIEPASLGAPFIFDLIPNRGPLGGLHTALAYAETPWIFLIACDYPLVTPELIALMASRLSERVNAVAPVQADGRPQPLCAFYRVAPARQMVTETIERPRVPPPMTEVLNAIRADLVTYDEYSHLAGADEFFLNINTQADLNSAVRRLEMPGKTDTNDMAGKSI